MFTLPLQDPFSSLSAFCVMLLLAPRIARALKVPSLAVLILFGIVVGPYAVGLFPTSDTSSGKLISLLGTLGAVYVMFLAGLGIDANQLKRYRKFGLGFGALSFFLPFLGGLAIGLFAFSWSIPKALLFGALFSTHSLVSSPIASRMGLSRDRSTIIATGGTIVADSLAMLCLALISATNRPDADFGFWFSQFSFIAIYFAALPLILPRVFSFIFRHVKSNGIEEFVFAFLILVVGVFFAKLVSLEPVVGAFLIGITLNRLIPEKSKLMGKLQFIGNALFVPLFLISAGMKVDLCFFANAGSTILLSGLMITNALVTKYIAAKAAQVAFKLSPSRGNLLFGLTVNKAVTAIVIAMVGFGSLKLFDGTILAGTILMIVVTCVTGSLVTERAAKRLASELLSGPGESAAAPQRILVPMANFDTARSLLDLAFAIRERDSLEPVYPLSVVQDSEDTEKDVAKSEKVLAPAVVSGVASGVPVTPITRVAINVADGISVAIRDLRISTVLIGWNGSPSIEHRLFGGVLEQVILQSEQLVIVSNLIRPTDSLTHCAVVLPPLIERHPGFGDGLLAIQKISQRLGIRTTLIGDEASGSAAERVMSGVDRGFALERYNLKDWGDSFDSIGKLMVPGGLVVVFCARPGRLGWQPSVDRLPRRIATEHPDYSMLIFYLTDEKRVARQGLAKIAQPILARAVEESLIRLDLEDGPIVDSLRELFKPKFQDKPGELERLSSQFGKISETEPVELKEGIVLLHAHVADVDEPTVFIGLSRGGFAIEKASPPVKLIFVLLAPKSQAPEDHLAMLAQIARLVQDGHSIKAILESRSISELAYTLGKASETK